MVVLGCYLAAHSWATGPGCSNLIEMSDVTRAILNFRDSGLSLGYQNVGLECTLAVACEFDITWT